MSCDCDPTVYVPVCETELRLPAPQGCVRLTLADRRGNRTVVETDSDGTAVFARSAFPQGTFNPYGGPYRCRIEACDDSAPPQCFWLAFVRFHRPPAND
ncbi:MAG: hypothetical protein RMM53_13450 [Bacteroidia bacterium]|nr:hypothetical protein [Bacteroidia bacterium]MDW8335215.1 hypothetical protein [Bacteroidia bacterium]